MTTTVMANRNCTCSTPTGIVSLGNQSPDVAKRLLEGEWDAHDKCVDALRSGGVSGVLTFLHEVQAITTTGSPTELVDFVASHTDVAERAEVVGLMMYIDTLKAEVWDEAFDAGCADSSANRAECGEVAKELA